LHRAAREIVERHEGRFPRDLTAIRALPGIGRYTAAAIASIAWDAREPILEANTVRLFSRLIALDRDLAQKSAQQILWDLSASLLPRDEVGLFNQALMELGSEVCTPRNPRCEPCPVALLCPTRALGLQDRIPRPKRRTAYEEIHEAAVVVRRGTRVLLRRCGPDQRWAGLWDFPRFPIQPCNGFALLRQLEDKTREMTGIHVQAGRQLTQIKHGVTRYRITLLCHEARRIGGRLRDRSMRWVPPTALNEYPLSVTGRRISRLLERGTSGSRMDNASPSE
jgi:A/G-specific adenine glycosylase